MTWVSFALSKNYIIAMLLSPFFRCCLRSNWYQKCIIFYAFLNYDGASFLSSVILFWRKINLCHLSQWFDFEMLKEDSTGVFSRSFIFWIGRNTQICWRQGNLGKERENLKNIENHVSILQSSDKTHQKLVSSCRPQIDMMILIKESAGFQRFFD